MNTNWYKLELGNGTIAYEPTKKIQDAWLQVALEAAKANRTDYSNAVFTNTAIGATNVTLFFTPSAEAIAIAFGASTCEKPNSSHVGLLVGDQRAWEIHFPGEVASRSR